MIETLLRQHKSAPDNIKTIQVQIDEPFSQ